MADDVKLKFAGDGADGERAIAQLERKYESLENKLKHLYDLSKRGSKDAKDGFLAVKDAVGDVGSAITGISGPMDVFLKLIQTAKSEFDDFVQRQEKSKTKTLDYAHAMEKLAVDLQGDPTLPVAQADKEVRRIAAKTGVDMKYVASALGTGVSAKGHLPSADIVPIVETVATAVPLLKTEHDMMVATIADLRKTDPRITPEGGFGFMLAAKQQARITELPSLVQHGMPAIIGLNKMDGGQNWRENAAIYAALTNAAQDPSGRKSRTASIALAVQMKEFLQDVPELKDNLDRIQFFQKHPDARKAFLEGGDFRGKRRKGLQMTVTGEGGEQFNIGTDRASFEKQMLPAIQGLLGGSKTDVETLNEALKRIPEASGAQAIGEYQDFLRNIKGLGPVQAADTEQKLTALADLAFIGDEQGAMSAILRSRMDEVMQSAGVGWFRRQQHGVLFNTATMLGGADPSLQAQRQLGLQAAAMTPGSEGQQVLIRAVEILEEIASHVKPQPGIKGQVEAGANQ